MKLSIHDHGPVRLDGGAMFGSIPKALWARETSADEQNRIRLSTNSLVVEHGDARILVDVGCGNKWTDKQRSMYGIEPSPPLEGVTHILLTHLHFDHAGGLSTYRDGELIPCYPDAVHIVSEANLENARHPNARERASYLREDVEVLSHVHTIHENPFSFIELHEANGHTRGLRWLTVRVGGETIAFPGDLFPTSRHLPATHAMGYDMCAETCIREKAAFLERAIGEEWIVVFEHDPTVKAARIGRDERGRPVVAEDLSLNFSAYVDTLE